MYKYLYIYIYTYTHIHIYTPVYLTSYTYISVYLETSLENPYTLCKYIHIWICVYTDIYIYTCIYLVSRFFPVRVYYFFCVAAGFWTWQYNTALLLCLFITVCKKDIDDSDVTVTDSIAFVSHSSIDGHIIVKSYCSQQLSTNFLTDAFQ